MSCERFHARGDSPQYQATKMVYDDEWNHLWIYMVSICIYLMNLSAESFSLPKHTVLTSANSAQVSILHASGDEQCKTDDAQLDNSVHNYHGSRDTNKISTPTGNEELQTLRTQNIDSAVNSLHFKSLQRREGQRDRPTQLSKEGIEKKKICAARSGGPMWDEILS